MFKCKRAFLEPLKSHHPGSHFWAEKRLSHPVSHTHTPPCWTSCCPQPPSPEPQATVKLCNHPSRLCANIYIAPLRGLQQTQHGGAALQTLSRPQSWPGVADTPQSWQASLIRQVRMGQEASKQSRSPCYRSGMTPSWSIRGEVLGEESGWALRPRPWAQLLASCRCTHLPYLHTDPGPEQKAQGRWSPLMAFAPQQKCSLCLTSSSGIDFGLLPSQGHT